MGILIIGKPSAPEQARFREEGRGSGIPVVTAPMSDIVFRFGAVPAPMLRRKRIDRSFRTIVFRSVYPYISEALLLAEWCAAEGVRVIDRGLARREFIRSKAYDTWKLRAAGIRTAPGFQALSKAHAAAELARSRFPLVAKGVHGSKGRYVHLCTGVRQARTLMAGNPDEPFLFERFLDVRHEYRVLVLGGRVLGSVRKDDVPGDFRRNASLGGTGVPSSPSAAVRRICERSARILGCEFAGIDVAVAKDGRTYVLDVNRAPGFIAFERDTGMNIAEAFIAYAWGGRRR